MSCKLPMTVFQWSQEENNQVSVCMEPAEVRQIKLFKLRQPLMATWVNKHLSSSAGSHHDPDFLGLKEQQQLGFSCLSQKKNTSPFTWRENRIQSKACVPPAS